MTANPSSERTRNGNACDALSSFCAWRALPSPVNQRRPRKSDIGIRLHLLAGLLLSGLCAACCAQASPSAASSETADLNRWSACKQPIECTAVLDPCGDAASTSKTHAAQYRAWANEQRPRVDCSKHCFKTEAELSSFIPAGRASNKCVHGQCKIVPENLCPASETSNNVVRQ